MIADLSRRDLIVGGVAVAALPLAGGIATMDAHPFLYDDRFDLDGRLLARARRSGLRPIPGSDISRIAQALDHDRLAGIAGVTGGAAFFIVEQLAQRRGLRLRHRLGSSWAFGAAALAFEGEAS